MTELISLQEINQALRLDLFGTPPTYAADPRTPDILRKIAQAQDIVLDFIQPAPDPEWDEETVPARVTAAITIAVRCLLDDTEDSMAMISGLSGKDGTDMKNPIVALLWRLRQPSLA
jgi:hypothetical protein